MPWTEKQRKLFNAAAHDPKIRREHGMSEETADDLADEANELKRRGKEKSASLPTLDLSPVFGGRNNADPA